MATVRAGAASVARLGANISAAAESVPASALRAEGVDPAAVERLTSESRELATSGPTTLGVDRFDRTFYTQLSTIVASHNEGDHDLGRAGTLLTGNVVNLHVTGPDGDETVVSFRITDEGRIEDVGAGAHSRAKIKMSTDRETMRSISDANNPGAAFRNAVQSGAIRIDGLAGGFDLQATLESGQSYCWRREDGRMYEADAPYGGSAWYYTVVDPEALQTVSVRDSGPQVIRARQVDGRLEWESTTDAEPYLRELLRLDDDLAAIRERSPDDAVIQDAYERFAGMRLVQDPPFACLVSFICSAQMRVSRIHGMVSALARTFGTGVEFDGRTYHGVPAPERLAAASEAELRDLNLGYRAPYVRETAAMVADGEDPGAARDRPCEDAREYLTRCVGVGEKVADCVCLFSLDHLEAVPLDTWIRTAIEDHFPECAGGTYAETSRAIRERFGGAVAGYVQTYVFYHLRTG